MIAFRIFTSIAVQHVRRMVYKVQTSLHVAALQRLDVNDQG